jgi:hypothetical protein
MPQWNGSSPIVVPSAASLMTGGGYGVTTTSVGHVQAVCPLVLVWVSPSSVHGPFAELALNIWPGTISPTDSV